MDDTVTSELHKKRNKILGKYAEHSFSAALDEINETELKNLEKRDDGKFEVLDVKLDNRKTKNLDINNEDKIATQEYRLVTFFII